jgi:hypothetical protein
VSGLSPGPDTLEITALGPSFDLPGDYSENGLVDMADYQTFKSRYQSAVILDPTDPNAHVYPGAFADGNRDGISGADRVALRALVCGAEAAGLLVFDGVPDRADRHPRGAAGRAGRPRPGCTGPVDYTHLNRPPPVRVLKSGGAL